MLTRFPGIYPLPPIKKTSPSQVPSTREQHLPTVPLQDEVHFGSKLVNPLPVRKSPKKPVGNTKETRTPEEIEAAKEKAKARLARLMEVRKQRTEIAKQIEIGTSVHVPLPEFFYYGYVTGAIVTDLIEIPPPKNKRAAARMNTSAASKILESPEELMELWSKLGMPESEMPEADWENEAVVFLAENRTRQATLKPQSITYYRQTDTLAITISPETKPGKEPGVSWYMATLPLVGGLTEDEQQKMQRHLELYNEGKAMTPQDRQNFALVLNAPLKLSAMSTKTKPNLIRRKA